MTNRRLLLARLAIAWLGILLLAAGPAAAKDIGAEAPRCAACVTCGSCAGALLPEPSNTGSTISRSEANVTESAGTVRVSSGAGTTLDFVATYNSYNADTSRAQVDTVMGYGWTHPYNVFLFPQVGSMFRYDGDGRVTRYKVGTGGTYTAAPGYFETLVKNPDGSFTLTRKDRTTFTFKSIAGTPFIVVGPVFRLAKIVDRNGNTTTLNYAGGNLVSVTDTYGRSITFTYTALKKIASVTDPAGRVTAFQYDSTGRKLTRVTDANGKWVQYTYNTLYQLTSKIDKDGRTFTYTYTSNNPSSVRDGAGTSRAVLSNPNNWATDPTQLAMNQTRVYLPSTTTTTDGRGNPWRYQYDSRGYLTRVIAPDGATTSYTYDPASLMVSSTTDPRGQTSTYTYDAQGNRTQQTNPLGQVTSYTYEPVYNNVTSVTDPRGRTTTYAYDANGNKVLETDPLGQTRSWTYDSHASVLSWTDKNGHTTNYSYDAVGNLTQTTDALGHATTMTYDAVGNLLSQTDPNGHTTSYQYDGMDRPIVLMDPAGNTTQTLYNGDGERVEVIDRNGHTVQYSYDLRRRLITTTDAVGNTDLQTYDGNDNRISATDRSGRVTTYQYDSHDRLIRTTDALGNVTTTSYDLAGNALTETDANAHTTSSAYDGLNRRVLVTDAIGAVTQTAYDTGTLTGCPLCGATPGSRLVTKQTDANGKVTYYKYDALDRLIRIVRKVGSTADTIAPGDAVTAYSYDPHGNRAAITEPNGNAITFVYDALNRKTSQTNAAGDVSQQAYDPAGNVVGTTAPNGNVTVATYDSRDRLVQVTDGGGAVVSYSYDPGGNRVSETDGNGSATSHTYDALDRLVTSTDALGQTTTFQYDPVGNLLQGVDRNAHTTTFTYDALNRRTSLTDPLGNVTSYQYDAAGRQLRVTDANSHATVYQYDDINRLVRETYANGTFRTFVYDGVGNLTRRTDQIGQVVNYAYNDLYLMTQRSYPSLVNDTFTYDLSGRVLSAQRGTWPVTFTYDGANRITQTTQNGHAVAYSYNVPAGTRTITYPGGRVIVEQNDVRSRIGHVDDSSSPTPIVSYAYDAANQPTSRAYRNGTTASYGYNANEWSTTVGHTSGVGPIATFAYAYDDEGNRTFEQKSHDATRSEAYQYDAGDRLIEYKVGTLVGSTVPAPTTQTAYALDAVGNWNSKTTNSVTETRTHDAVNEILTIDSTALSYDANGNLVSDGTYAYVYDEENRLIRVTRTADSAMVGQYQYDALGRRVVRVASPSVTPTTTVFLYDDRRVVEEQDGLGATAATYVYGTYLDELLTMDRGGQAYYYHQNASWSVAAITDSSATVVERYAYDAYGQPAVTDGAGVPVSPNAWGTPHSAIGNPYTFTGRELDEEAGLLYYRARYYDAHKGRFLQRDPLEYVDGLNLYQYVASNPVTGTDPEGLTLKVGGAVIGYGSALYERLSQNDFYLDVLDRMISSNVTFERKSIEDLELELKMREAFVKCMRRQAPANGGCSYPAAGTGASASSKGKGWGGGGTYRGDDPSAALDAFEAGPTTLDCYGMGSFCMWIALRDALGADEFNKRFKNKPISISGQMRDTPALYPPTKEENVLLPGDYVQFHNAPRYKITRKPNANSNYSSENAAFEGMVDGQDQYCGFGITSRTAEKMLQTLLNNYNNGAEKGTPEQTLDTWPLKMGKSLSNVRRPNPNYGK